MSHLGHTWSDAQCGTEAGYQRHHRAGERSCYPCLQALARKNADRGTTYTGPQTPDTRRVRNGLPPFRPYVYRGAGVDTLTGCPSSYRQGCRCDDCTEQQRWRVARWRNALREAS